MRQCRRDRAAFQGSLCAAAQATALLRRPRPPDLWLWSFGVGGDRLSTTGPHLTRYKKSEQDRRAQIWKQIPNSSREQGKMVVMFLQLGSRGVLKSTEETTKAH